LASSQQLQSGSVAAEVSEQIPKDRARLPLILKPIRGAKRTIVILSLALASCRGPVIPASPTPEVVSFRLYTDSATAPLLRDLTSSYHPPNLLVTWDIQVGDAGTVLNWLKTPDASYAFVDYTPGSGFENLWSTPVGEDGIAFVVHPSNPVTNLSAAQLRTVLQGRISNWKALGGADIPLTVVARNEGSSTATIIQTIVLGDRRTTRTARLATTSQAVVEMVSSDPGAIGYVSMGYLSPGVRALMLDNVAPTPDTVSAKQYPIRAPIVIVGARAPADDAYRAFFAWIQSPEGQGIVRQHYGGM
jgi:hypothetical protein